jgi:hypothetical protein
MTSQIIRGRYHDYSPDCACRECKAQRVDDYMRAPTMDSNEPHMSLADALDWVDRNGAH